MSRETDRAQLLRKAASAGTTLAEQTELVRQAELLRNEQLEAHAASNAWSAEDAVIRDTLVPRAAFERTSSASDWLVDMDTTADTKEASHRMVAEASLWFGRVSDDVKSYGDEYAEQARNLARRLAGQYGDVADVAERSFLDEANRLRTQAVKAGIVVEADNSMPEGEGSTPQIDLMTTEGAKPDEGVQATASMKRTASFRTDSFIDQMYDTLTAEAASTLPQVGDGGYPTDTFGLGQNSALPAGATDSNRGPVMQELAQANPSQDVVPTNDPGLSAGSKPFPVSGTKKESNMHVTCPNCGGHGKVSARTVQAARLPEISDITKLSASGLDQLDQVVDPHDNPSATPFPADVAFPWNLNPAGQVAAQIPQAEQQISERNARSPYASQAAASRKQAGGRDNSGWAGDMGARGTDYPGEQIGQYPQAGSSQGYVDPDYGFGGDQQPGPVRPYSHSESDDYTNNPGMGWAPGQPTQYDNGQASVSQTVNTGLGQVASAWKDEVDSDPNLQAAINYVNQRRAAVQRNN